MQALYLTNNINEKRNYNDFLSYLDSSHKFKSGSYELDLFSYERYKFIFKKEDYLIINFGVFIYNESTNQKALENFYYKVLQKKISLNEFFYSDEVRGHYCLIIINKNKISIINDKLGYFPIYYYQKNNFFSLSNSIMSLSKNNPVTINNIGVAQYLSENYKHLTYACCNENIFNEIHYLKPATILNIENDNITFDNYFDLKKEITVGKNNNFQNVVNDMQKILENNLSFLKDSDKKIYSDLTGGVDTRLNIALLEKNKIKYKTGIQAITEYSDFSNFGRYSELNIVNKISQHLNLVNTIFTEKDYRKKSKLIDDITFHMSNKQTYNRRTGYFLKLRDEGADILISGLSGTELFRLSYYDYFKKHKDLKLNIFLKEYVELVDILKDNFLNVKDYYQNLKNYYEEKLQNISHKNPCDLSAYIDYFAFYRTHFCRYLGLANSILPFYTPYGDYKSAIYMYETSYNLKTKFKIQRSIINNIDEKLAAINSTRGFPLGKIKISNFFRFVNLISKNVPQQYFTRYQKLKNYFFYIIIRFLFNNRIFYNFFFKKDSKELIKKNLWGETNDFSVIEKHDNLMQSDLKVFEIVDKNKLSAYIKKDCNFNVIDRVVNLNKILESSKIIEDKK